MYTYVLFVYYTYTHVRTRRQHHDILSSTTSLILSSTTSIQTYAYHHYLAFIAECDIWATLMLRLFVMYVVNDLAAGASARCVGRVSVGVAVAIYCVFVIAIVHDVGPCCRS